MIIQGWLAGNEGKAEGTARLEEHTYFLEVREWEDPRDFPGGSEQKRFPHVGELATHTTHVQCTVPWNLSRELVPIPIGSVPHTRAQVRRKETRKKICGPL